MENVGLFTAIEMSMAVVVYGVILLLQVYVAIVVLLAILTFAI